MQLARLLAAAATLTLAAPAQGAVTVIGNTNARMCFEAAEAKGAGSAEGLNRCDAALAEENLPLRDANATLVNRGILKLRLNRIEEAISDFDRAIGRDPDLGEAYVNKGMAVLRRDGAWADARALFDRAIEKKTRRLAIAYFGRGVANELGGEIKQAYLDYRQASRLEPGWRDPQVELARFTVRHP